MKFNKYIFRSLCLFIIMMLCSCRMRESPAAGTGRDNMGRTSANALPALTESQHTEEEQREEAYGLFEE